MYAKCIIHFSYFGVLHLPKYLFQTHLEQLLDYWDVQLYQGEFYFRCGLLYYTIVLISWGAIFFLKKFCLFANCFFLFFFRLIT